jgi:hypothetical protein
MMIFPGTLSLASGVMNVSADDAVREAGTVGIARVLSVSVQASRCDTTTVVTLAPVRYLKGPLEKKEITFSYTRYYWKQAGWPWQKDCDSVHYRMPPVAEGMKAGGEVIFTARYFPDWKECRVTGTMEMDQLEMVARLLNKK